VKDIHSLITFMYSEWLEYHSSCMRWRSSSRAEVAARKCTNSQSTWCIEPCCKGEQRDSHVWDCGWFS